MRAWVLLLAMGCAAPQARIQPAPVPVCPPSVVLTTSASVAAELAAWREAADTWRDVAQINEDWANVEANRASRCEVAMAALRVEPEPWWRPLLLGAGLAAAVILGGAVGYGIGAMR